VYAFWYHPAPGKDVMMSLLSDSAPPRKRFPTWLLPAVGYAVSIGSLIWVLRGKSFHETEYDLTHLNWAWVALALIFDMAASCSHAWRWRIILSPAERIPFWRSLQAVLIGGFYNEVLPLKAGEAVRVYLLTHWTKVHLPLSITSGVIEAVIDGFWLVAAFFLVTIGVQNLRHDLVRFAWVLGVCVLALAAVFLYLLFHKQHSYQVVSGHRWASQFLHWLDELHKLGQVRTLSGALGASLLYNLFQSLSIWSLLRADQYDFDVRQAALIMVVFRIVTLIPNAPGNAGTLQAATAWGVHLAGGEKGPAANAFGQANFFFTLLAHSIEGGIAILLTGINVGELHRRAHHAHKSAHLHVRRSNTRFET
jgi:uncharacterized protein (TIRG00374 family)